MKNNQVHYYWLDLIRFLAAFLVLSSHFRGASFVEYGLLPAEQQNAFMSFFYLVTRLGHEAVLIFFVMSGFLVGGRVLERLKNGVFDLKTYGIDRSVRILLPLVSTLLFLILTNFIQGIDTDWIAWFGNLLSLQGIYCSSVIDPLWSLSYEVWFYILAGSLAMLFKKHINGIAIPFIILLICLLVFTKLNPAYLFIWVMGAITYWVQPKTCNKFLLCVALLAMIILIGTLQFTRVSRSLSLGEYSSFLPNRDALELLFSFTFCLFLQQVILICPVNCLARFINSMGTKFAAFSYTLYLTHMLVLRLLEYYGAPKSTSVNWFSVGYYIGELILSMIVAYFIYWIFEKRTATVKSWLKNRQFSCRIPCLSKRDN